MNIQQKRILVVLSVAVALSCCFVSNSQQLFAAKPKDKKRKKKTNIEKKQYACNCSMCSCFEIVEDADGIVDGKLGLISLTKQPITRIGIVLNLLVTNQVKEKNGNKKLTESKLQGAIKKEKKPIEMAVEDYFLTENMPKNDLRKALNTCFRCKKLVEKLLVYIDVQIKAASMVIFDD